MSQPDRITNDENDRNREPGDSLAKAPDLQQNYEQAQQATQPLQPSSPGPTRPPITAAQQTDPIKALDVRASQQQRSAANSQGLDPVYKQRMAELVAERRAGQGLNGSQMVQQQAPAPILKPSTPVGKAQDAQAFNKQWSAEQARAAAYQKNMKEAIAEEKKDQAQASQQDQSWDQGQGRA